MQKKLLIWDFDGVIADTEKIWLKNRQTQLKNLGIEWNWKTVNKYLRGTSDKTKREVLDKLGIITDDQFWIDSLKMDVEAIIKNGFILTPDIEHIFSMNIKQCIATGGVWDKTLLKIKAAGIEKYFPHNKIFTADMVIHGKPEPDLFLYAAEHMNEKPENTVIIEDSIAGLTAALKANCLPVAFLGGDLADDKNYLKQVQNLGIKNIFHNMKDIKQFLETLF